MKKIVLMAVAMLGALAVSCGKSDDTQNNSGNSEQTIPTSSYNLSPDGKALVKWINTEATSVDMQADKVLSEVTIIGQEAFKECG